MNNKRFFFVMVAITVLVAGAGVGAIFYGNLALKKQSDQLVNLKLQNQILDEQQTALKKASKDIAKYSDLEDIAKAIVPQDKDEAKVVREIVNIANGAGISIATISFPTSTLGAAPAASPNSSSTSKTSTTTSISQAKPVDGLPGVYQVLIDIQSVNQSPKSYDNFLKFLEGLENNRRTAQVATIQISPKIQNKSIVSYDYDLGINVYVKPGTTK